jgi:hypothetical protein
MAEIHIAIRSSIWCPLLNWDTELEISSYRTAVSRVFHQGVLHFFITTRNKGLCSVHMSPHVTRAFVPSLYIPDRTPACNPSVLYDTTPHQNVHLYDCMAELQAGWMVLRMVWCTAWYPALPLPTRQAPTSQASPTENIAWIYFLALNTVGVIRLPHLYLPHTIRNVVYFFFSIIFQPWISPGWQP